MHRQGVHTHARMHACMHVHTRTHTHTPKKASKQAKVKLFFCEDKNSKLWNFQ